MFKITKRITRERRKGRKLNYCKTQLFPITIQNPFSGLALVKSGTDHHFSLGNAVRITSKEKLGYRCVESSHPYPQVLDEKDLILC